MSHTIKERVKCSNIFMQMRNRRSVTVVNSHFHCQNQIVLSFISLLVTVIFVDNITAIAWHPTSRYLATAGGNDRQIRVWHNAVGIKVEIGDLEGRLIRAKSDTIRVGTHIAAAER